MFFAISMKQRVKTAPKHGVLSNLCASFGGETRLKQDEPDLSFAVGKLSHYTTWQIYPERPVSRPSRNIDI